MDTNSVMQAPWLNRPETQEVVKLLNTPLYFQGGTVRDSLLKRKPRDIDILVDLNRQEIIHRFTAAGLQMRLSHDDAINVMTTINDLTFDIFCGMRNKQRPVATLQRTDGALPNDFTIHSLYFSPEGQFYDYYGGVADLEAGRIRFTEDAQARINDSPSGIIRFFRFQAEFGREPPDMQAVEICAANAHRLWRLHTDLLRKNMFNLLRVRRISPMLALMQKHHILEPIFGFPLNDCRLMERLEMLENLTKIKPDAHVRTIFLLLHSSLPALKALDHVRQRWDMEENSYQWKHNLLSALAEIDPQKPQATRERLRSLKPVAFQQAALLKWVREPEPMQVREPYEQLISLGNQ